MRLIAILIALLLNSGLCATYNWTNGWNLTGYMPGDTVTNWGTNTATGTITNSGTSGSPITFIFAPGSRFQSSAWSSAGAIAAANKGWIVLDGLNNGIIENTNNGDGLGNQSANSYGILLTSCSNFIVRNFTIQNLYVRTNTGTSNGGANWGVRINAGHDLEVSSCMMHDVEQGITSSYGAGCSNFNFYSNTIYRVNIGITDSDNDPSSTLTNLNIWGNTIYSFTNWNDTLGNTFHHNAVYCWNEQGGATSPLNGANVYRNLFGPGLGGPYSTSLVYFSGDVRNIAIYNNIFLASPGEYTSPGLIYLLPFTGGPHSIGIYNNTFIAGGLGSTVDIAANASYVSSVVITNNLGSGGGGGSMVAVYNSNGNFTFASDYNLFYNYDAGTPFSYSTTGSGNFKSIAQWQALGFDVHGLSGNPLLSASYSLNSGSPAINAGVTIPLFSTDFNGTNRPQGSAWDIGAWEYVPPLTNGIMLFGTGTLIQSNGKTILSQ